MSGFLQAAGVWIDGGDSYPSRPALNQARSAVAGLEALLPQPPLLHPASTSRPVLPPPLNSRMPAVTDCVQPPLLAFDFLTVPAPRQPKPMRTNWPAELLPLLAAEVTYNVWIQPPPVPRLPASVLMASPHSAASTDPLLTIYAFPVDFWLSDPSPPRAIPAQKPHRSAPAGDGTGIAVIVEPFWSAAIQSPAHAPQYGKPRLPLHVATTGELASGVAETLAAPIYAAAIQMPAHAPRLFRKVNVSEAAPWVQDSSIPFTGGTFWASSQETAPPRRWILHTVPEATAFQTDPVWVRLPPWPFPQDPGPPRLPRQSWRLHFEWACPPPIAVGVITVTGPYYAVASNVYQQGAAEGDASTLS